MLSTLLCLLTYLLAWCEYGMLQQNSLEIFFSLREEKMNSHLVLFRFLLKTFVGFSQKGVKGDPTGIPNEI